MLAANVEQATASLREEDRAELKEFVAKEFDTEESEDLVINRITKLKELSPQSQPEPKRRKFYLQESEVNGLSLLASLSHSNDF